MLTYIYPNPFGECTTGEAQIVVVYWIKFPGNMLSHVSWRATRFIIDAIVEILQDGGLALTYACSTTGFVRTTTARMGCIDRSKSKSIFALMMRLYSLLAREAPQRGHESPALSSQLNILYMLFLRTRTTYHACGPVLSTPPEHIWATEQSI